MQYSLFRHENHSLNIVIVSVSCFYLFGFTARQDYMYFIHFEPGQSLGGAKTEDPRDLKTT